MKKENKYFLLSIIAALILTAFIIFLDPFVSDVKLLADKGSSWYYWKLPNRVSWIMVVVWVLFFVHLIGNFILIKKKVKVKKIEFDKYNSYLLLWNLVFIILHFVESIFLYDGLAQDVPVWSSQYSVILLLIVLLVMQASTRGIFLGYKIKLSSKSYKFLFATHGFIFTTAIIYTFWFHPMINTIGHLTGFFYMFLLMIQISFMKTKIHYNKKWILTLELLVAFHGASVAYFIQSSALWSMFFFGFLFIFFMTQIYNLNIKKSIRTTLQVLFLLISVGYYISYDITKVHQILWIPMIEYLGALLLIGLFYFIFSKNKKKNIS